MPTNNNMPPLFGGGAFGGPPVVPPPPQGYPQRGYDSDSSSNGSSSGSTTTRNSYDVAIDNTSGQDIAASLSEALLSGVGDDLLALMTDPIAAIATGDRIRNLSRMIQAYKGGYDLPDLEVVPHSRVADESFSTSTTTNSSGSGSRTNRTRQTGRNL